MNSVPPITAGSISGMTGIEERPVYFLNVNGARTPNVVVKGEIRGKGVQDIETSIVWSAKLMKHVNNSAVNSKIMTPNEVAAFVQSASRAFTPNTKQFKNAVTDQNQWVWVKMPFVPGLSDGDIFTPDNKVIYDKRVKKGPLNLYDMQKVRETLAKFLSDTVWFELGKIVAVDVFNGNFDRFNPDTGAWTNKGNILFVRNGLTSVIGLDTYSAQNRAQKDGLAFSNLNARGSFGALKTLNDAGYRRDFARKCLRSIGEEFKTAFNSAGLNGARYHVGGNQNLPLTITAEILDNFFVDMFLDHFERGLTQGSDDLKRYLQDKVRQARGGWVAARPKPQVAGQRYAPVGVPARPSTPSPVAQMLPPGVISRMEFLHWI